MVSFMVRSVICRLQTWSVNFVFSNIFTKKYNCTDHQWSIVRVCEKVMYIYTFYLQLLLCFLSAAASFLISDRRYVINIGRTKDAG
jgi:hypothetical protein